MLQVDMADIGAIQSDGALLRHLDALDEARDGGFARARTTDDGNHLPLLYREGNLLQRRRRIGVVAEGNLVEIHRAADAGDHTGLRGIALGRVAHYMAEHFDGQRGFLVFVDQPHHLHQRARDTARNHVERHQRADAEIAIEHLERAETEQAYLHQFLQPLGQHAGDGRDAPHRHPALDAVDGALVPGLGAAGLQRQRFHGADAVDGFHQMPLLGALRLVKLLKLLAESGQQKANDSGHGAGEYQHDHRELNAVDEQHDQHQRQGQHVEEGEEQPAGEEVADGLRLLHMARQHAGGSALEEEQRQAEQVLEGARGQARVDLAHQVIHQILPHILKHAVEQRQHDEDDQQRIECLVAVVGDDLVDHDLEHQRRREGDERREQRSNRYIAEIALIGQHLGYEPAEAELALVGHQREAGLLAGDQDAAPFRHELVARAGLDAFTLDDGVENIEAGFLPLGGRVGLENNAPAAVMHQRHHRVGVAERQHLLPALALQHLAAQA